jgi:hypothetical protein
MNNKGLIQPVLPFNFDIASCNVDSHVRGVHS